MTEQVNVNTNPAQPVAEEIEETRPDGTVVRRRVVSNQPVVAPTTTGTGTVNVNIPPGPPGTTNVNVNR